VQDGFHFDEAAADRVCEFFEERLTFTTDFPGGKAGDPFRLQPWQRKFLRELFGWKRADGRRRYKRAGLFVPRKNGKTELAAGLGLYLTGADGENAAEVYSAAGDRQQAARMHEAAGRMVNQSPGLSKHYRVFKRAITFEATGSSYRTVSADARLSHGSRPHAVLFDELHVQKNRDLWEALASGQGSRSQPLLIWISTAGIYDREGLCFKEYEYACKVRDGVIEDPEFLPMIFEAGKDEDWTSPETWKKANPNLGVSIDPGWFEAECRKAQEDPGAENQFRAFNLNQWVEQAIRWMPIAKWDACAGPVDEAALAGKPCWSGLDLGQTSDITALVHVFAVDGRLVWLPRFWIPKEAMLRRSRRDRVPYKQWCDEGLIEATPGDVTDYDYVIKRAFEDADKFRIKEIAFDRWGAAQVSQRLEAEGLTVVPFGQGYASMSHPTKELMRHVLDGKLQHGGNPVLRWMAGNVVVEQDAAGNLKPSKRKSNEKIDGIVAGVMGLDRALRHIEKKPSIYESDDYVVGV
jgi:phage terminase large subunit-like protein